ncbi:Hemicentin-1 [Exaiptasia diaphana]|nr:Hemicentin-1 [Exaiptasia diaphana]
MKSLEEGKTDLSRNAHCKWSFNWLIKKDENRYYSSKSLEEKSLYSVIAGFHLQTKTLVHQQESLRASSIFNTDMKMKDMARAIMFFLLASEATPFFPGEWDTNRRGKCPFYNCPGGGGGGGGWDIDGNWGHWSSWSRCSVICGTGTRTRTRHCDNPAPQYGGKPCAGNSQSTENCRSCGLGNEDCESSDVRCNDVCRLPDHR